MAFDIQPPKKKRPVKQTPAEPKVVVEPKKSTPKSVPAKPKVRPAPKVKKQKPVKPAKVKKVKKKKTKTSKQSSGALAKFFISLIGIAILVGGVIFIRQNQSSVNNTESSDNPAGFVESFSNDLPTTIIPEDEEISEEPAEPTGPGAELVNLHNDFINELNQMDDQDEVMSVLENDEDIINIFDEYLDEF